MNFVCKEWDGERKLEVSVSSQTHFGDESYLYFVRSIICYTILQYYTKYYSVKQPPVSGVSLAPACALASMTYLSFVENRNTTFRSSLIKAQSTQSDAVDKTIANHTQMMR